MSTESILTVAAALHWLREETELPERSTPHDLIAAARRNLTHVHPADRRWQRFDDAKMVLRAAGELG